MSIAAKLVDRFLGWKLPKSFSPDNGIIFIPTSFQKGKYADAHWPCGTNLLDATQATEMVQYMLKAFGPLIPMSEITAVMDATESAFGAAKGEALRRHLNQLMKEWKAEQ